MYATTSQRTTATNLFSYSQLKEQTNEPQTQPKQAHCRYYLKCIYIYMYINTYLHMKLFRQSNKTMKVIMTNHKCMFMHIYVCIYICEALKCNCCNPLLPLCYFTVHLCIVVIALHGHRFDCSTATATATATAVATIAFQLCIHTHNAIILTFDCLIFSLSELLKFGRYLFTDFALPFFFVQFQTTFTERS